MRKEWEKKASFYTEKLANLYCYGRIEECLTKYERKEIQNSLDQIAKLAQEDNSYKELYATYLYLYLLILSNVWEKKYQDEMPICDKEIWRDLASELWIKNMDIYLRTYDPDIALFSTYLQNCITLVQLKRDVSLKTISALSGYVTGSQHHSHILKAIKTAEQLYPHEIVEKQIYYATKLYRSADFHGKQIVKIRISHMKESGKYMDFIKQYDSVEEAEDVLKKQLQQSIDAEDFGDRGFEGSYEIVEDFYFNIYERKEQSLDAEHAPEITYDFDIDEFNSATVIMDFCELLLNNKEKIPKTHQKRIVECASACYGYFVYDTSKIDPRNEMSSFKERKILAQMHPFILGDLEIPNKTNSKVIKSTIAILQLGVQTEYLWCHQTECPKVIEMLDRAEAKLLPKEQQEEYDKQFKKVTYSESAIKTIQKDILCKDADFDAYLMFKD